VNRNNQIAVAGMFACSSFSYYLISFYMASSPGDIYLNFASTGIADILSSFVLNFFMKRYSLTTCYNACVAGLMVFSLSFYLFVSVDQENDSLFMNHLIAFLIMGLRMLVNSCFFLSYLFTSLLFPTLLRSKVFSINNLLSRPITMLAPLLIRIDNPISLLIIASCFYVVFLRMIEMPTNQADLKGFDGK
jgi:hypothetical protein